MVAVVMAIAMERVIAGLTALALAVVVALPLVVAVMMVALGDSSCCGSCGWDGDGDGNNNCSGDVWDN